MVLLGKDFKDHVVVVPCLEQGHLPPDQVVPSPHEPGLEQFQEWGIQSSLENLFHSLPTFTVNNSLPISNLNTLFVRLKPLL